MLSSISNFKLALLIGLVSVTNEVIAVDRGVAWAVDNRWATAFTNTSITWYHHWQDASISNMASNIQYVPMNWGPQYASLWTKRQAQMNTSLPEYLLSYNEPDVVSQANMTPSEAINGFLTDIQPWRERGVLVSSPQIVWNTTWLSTFMKGIRANGTDVDFMAIHYYGSWNDTATPKKYIQGIYNTYKKPIWITELGTTQKSNGTQEQQIGFMNSMLDWMATQSYVQRVVWSGAWSIANPPDNYIAMEDGMFYPNATLREIGLEYAEISAPVVTTSSSSSSTSTTSSSVKTTSTAAPPMTTTSTVHSTSTTPIKTTSTPTSTPHSTSSSTKKTTTTTSSTKKATSTSTKKMSTSTKHTSTSTKHKSTSTHHTSTSTKHSTTTRKATSTSKCRVVVNKGNVVRNWVDNEQEE
jgi:hypothetical protein